ncbi:TBCE protein, partial [Polypterus senegalus]
MASTCDKGAKRVQKRKHSAGNVLRIIAESDSDFSESDFIDSDQEIEQESEKPASADQTPADATPVHLLPVEHLRAADASTASHPTGASFIRPKKASFGVDFLTAVKKRYEIQEASEITEEMKISNTFVELVNGAERPINVLQSLKLLDLGNNRLSDGGDLLEIAFLPRYDVVIFRWSFVNELEKLQSLQQLSCLYNPLMTSEKSTETIRQLIIAKIGQLLFLNKSEVLPDERKGAELDYRKLFGKEWLEAGGHWDEDKNHPNESFIAQHPRFQFLIKKFGPPEEGELKQQQPFALKNQLLTLTFRFPGRPDAPIEKKLPNSMTVQKVKGLLSRLLKVPATELNLTYTRAKIEDKEVDLDNDLRSLKFFSIEDGDTVLVRWT